MSKHGVCKTDVDGAPLAAAIESGVLSQSEGRGKVQRQLTSELVLGR